MGKQYNKMQKRARRKAYIARIKQRIQELKKAGSK